MSKRFDDTGMIDGPRTSVNYAGWFNNLLTRGSLLLLSLSVEIILRASGGRNGFLGVGVVSSIKSMLSTVRWFGHGGRVNAWRGSFATVSHALLGHGWWVCAVYQQAMNTGRSEPD